MRALMCFAFSFLILDGFTGLFLINQNVKCPAQRMSTNTKATAINKSFQIFPGGKTLKTSSHRALLRFLQTVFQLVIQLRNLIQTHS